MTKLMKFLGITLPLVWMLWVVVVYFIFQPSTVTSFVALPYWPLLLLITGFAAIGNLAFGRMKSIRVRGIYWIGLFLIASSLVLASFLISTGRATLGFGSSILSFNLFTIYLLLILVLLFGASWSLGDIVTQKIHLPILSESTHLRIGLGISIITLLATIAGLVNQLTFLIALLLVIIPFLINYKRAWKKLISIFWARREIKIYNKLQIPLFLSLLFSLGIAWIGSIKPFPTGNDGTTYYMALTKYISEYGGLQKGGQAHAWSVFMSFGELLLGSTTLSILLSTSMGFLTLHLFYSIARKWLPQVSALLSVCLIFLSPFLAFHFIVDEKVDLAALYFVLIIVALICNKEVRNSFQFSGDKSSTIPIIIIVGWLLGFIFTIKYSSAILVLSVMPFLMARATKELFGFYLVFLGGFYFLASSLFGINPIPATEKSVVSISFILLGTLSLYRYGALVKHIRPRITALILLLGSFTIPFLPWAIKHAGENHGYSMEEILEGAADEAIFIANPRLIGYDATINKDPRQQGIDNRPQFIQLSSEDDTSPPTIPSKYEELQRYLGFEQGIWRLLSLPSDLTFSINIVGNRYMIIGFLFLAMIPLLFFSRKGIGWNVLLTLGSLGWISLSLYSINDYNSVTKGANEILLLKDLLTKQPVYLQGIIESLTSVLVTPLYSLGQLMTFIYDVGGNVGQGYSALIVVITSLFLIMKGKDSFKEWRTSLKVFTFLIVSTGITWWISGMGVVWYGLIVFTALPLIVVYIWKNPEKHSNTLFHTSIHNKALGAMIYLQLAVFFVIYFTNVRVVGTENMLFSHQQVSYISDPTMSRYDIIKESNETHAEVLEVLNGSIDDPNNKIYLVNTQLGYHIDNYDERVFTDHLLISYGENKSRYGDKLDYAEALAFNGYKYVLFDINTPTLDKTPERSLARRCQNFVNELIRSNKVELLTTDNIIYDVDAPEMRLPNGQMAKARYGLMGKTIIRGTVMLFKIKDSA